MCRGGGGGHGRAGCRLRACWGDARSACRDGRIACCKWSTEDEPQRCEQRLIGAVQPPERVHVVAPSHRMRERRAKCAVQRCQARILSGSLSGRLIGSLTLDLLHTRCCRRHACESREGLCSAMLLLRQGAH